MKEIIWEEFDIAEMCGKNTITNMADAKFNEYRDNIEWLTMLIMVINHKSWHHHDIGNDNLSELYAELYYKYYEEAIELLEVENRDADLTYFIRTLD